MKHINLLKYKIFSKFNNLSRLINIKISKIRPSSYPYLSGDTFRLMSDFIIETEKDLITFVGGNSEGRRIIFMSASFIDSFGIKKILIYLESLNATHLKNATLIIHNGDRIPKMESLKILAKFFNKIFSVNLIEEYKNIYPIPIGIENLHYLKNGSLNYFQDYKKHKFEKKINKDYVVFSCFNINTNYEIRSQVRNALNKSRFTKIFTSLSTSNYYHGLARSLFSISPPGNGMDCHRTWEAIYFESVPVILSGTLHQELIKNLPIISVNSYSEFLKKSDEELIDIYYKLMKNKNTDMAYFDFWARKIKNQIIPIQNITE